MILTLTGGSGFGKTTIAKEILEFLPQSFLVTSLTTRDPRQTDLLGEYKYLSNLEKESLDKSKLLWSAEIRGKFYATTKSSVDMALRGVPSSSIGIMILIPEKIETLYSYCRSLVLPKNHLISVYLEVDEDVARKRLLNRNLSDEEMEKEMAHNRNVSLRVNSNRGLYVSIENNKRIKTTLKKILLALSLRIY